MPKRRRGGHSKSKIAIEIKQERMEEIITAVSPEPEDEPMAEPPPVAGAEEEEIDDDEVTAAVEELFNSASRQTDLVSESPAPAVQAVPTTGVLQVARTRLTGLLNRANKSSGNDESDEEDDIPLAQTIARPESPQEKLNSPAPVTPVARVKTETGTSGSLSGRQVAKRRRRREAVSDSAFHHTYVMKLFDRSVDLAQFSETTSLYPVCRAWMANQPRNPNLLPKLRTPTPPPSDDEEDKSEKEEDSTKDSVEGDIKDVYKMPPPEAPVLQDNTTMRVPSPDQHIVQPIIINQENVEGGRDERLLLMEHVKHWRSVKSKWMQAGHQNEQRFHESISIIEEIYKKAQELYA